MRTLECKGFGLWCVGVCVCVHSRIEPVYAYKKNPSTQSFVIYTKMLIVSQQFLEGNFFASWHAPIGEREGNPETVQTLC